MLNKNINVYNQELFSHVDVDNIAAVRVYYVGQGDAIGLVDDKGDVVLYVDYGGMIDHPDKVNNFKELDKRLVPESRNKPINVILTHWDKDHYYSAKHVAKIRNSQWVVPRQRIGPQALKFSASLTNVYCWPERMVKKPVSFHTKNGDTILIEKIEKKPRIRKQKEDRNLTGLAVSIIKKNKNNKKHEFVLLPGDAPYHKIGHFQNLVKKMNFKGGVAYHHGSHSHWKSSTSAVLGNPRTGAKLVYSYGPSNTYGHPDRSNYDALNWSGHTDETPNHNGQNYIEISL